MILFKAIHYDGVSEKKFSSRLLDSDTYNKDWTDYIEDAFSHVSHGDRKKKGDVWISATYDYHSAIEYLKNERYSFNGIAIINLPNTFQTGCFYDKTLKKEGYLDKDMRTKTLLSSPNEDGIFTILDVSDIMTIYYMTTHLWFKGRDSSIGNIRALRNASSSKEVLILGTDVPFTFLSREDAFSLYEKNQSFENKLPNKHHLLYQYLLSISSDPTIADSSGQNLLKNMTESYLEEGINWMKEISIENGTSHGDDFLEIDEKGIKDRVRKEIEERIVQMFENCQYSYNHQKAIAHYYEFPTLRYEDKDEIDFSLYHITNKKLQLTVSDIMAAYIYSGVYWSFKDNSCCNILIWKVLNAANRYSYLEGTLSKDDFINHYNSAFGIAK